MNKLNFVSEFPLLALVLPAGAENKGGEDEEGGEAGGGDGEGRRQDGDVQLGGGEREVLQSLPPVSQAAPNLTGDKQIVEDLNCVVSSPA